MKSFAFRDREFVSGKKTLIMGILNVTPDSFSDGGKYNTTEKAVAHALKMAEDGADIIDIGAVSTRPFGEYADEEEEWGRLKNILPVLRRETELPLSVDTFRPVVAEKALALGADIINDVGGVFSQEMAALIKKYDAGWILMHGGVNVNASQTETDYPMGIVNHVQEFFDETVMKTAAAGIDISHICLDPGFGFMKNTRQNAELLDCLELLDPNGAALLCALSRKRFIGELSGDLSSERLPGTLAANVLAALKGADIVRVHDVAEHKKALSLLNGL